LTYDKCDRMSKKSVTWAECVHVGGIHPLLPLLWPRKVIMLIDTLLCVVVNSMCLIDSCMNLSVMQMWSFLWGPHRGDDGEVHSGFLLL
jgi:hypothetical protein